VSAFVLTVTGPLTVTVPDSGAGGIGGGACVPPVLGGGSASAPAGAASSNAASAPRRHRCVADRVKRSLSGAYEVS
jgi:hypothetical protein